MAWQLVGVTSGVGTSNGYTISLNGTLTGGIASSPAPGDLVVAMSAFGNTASSAPNISGNNSGAYTRVGTAIHANDTWDTEFSPFWKVMGVTPDTTLTVTRVTNTAYGGATVVQVWRGVDTASPFIGNATNASGTNGCVINPPAYDPAVADALIFAGGAGTMAATSSAYTAFTGMSNFLTAKGDGSTSDCAVAMASYAYAGVSYDPPTVSGGTTSTSSSWGGETFAFRPYTAPTLAVGDGGHGHTADSFDLTAGSYLALQEGAHGHAADNLTLTADVAANLVVQDAAHAQTADNLALTLATSTLLVVAEALHAHAGDNASLSVSIWLAVLDAGHTHVADNVMLDVTTVTNLLPAEATHGHAVDVLTLSSQAALAVADAWSSHTAEQPTLVAVLSVTLSPADGLHAHQIEPANLATQVALGVGDAISAHIADVLTLGTGVTTLLAVSEAAHSHVCDPLTLTVYSALAVSDALHGQLSDGIEISVHDWLLIQDGLHGHAVSGVVFGIEETLQVLDALHGHLADDVPLNTLVVVVLARADLGGDAVMAISRQVSATRGMVATRMEAERINLRAALRDYGLRRP